MHTTISTIFRKFFSGSLVGVIMLYSLLIPATLFFTNVSFTSAAEIGSGDATNPNFQLVPCDGSAASPCDYAAFMKGIQRIINACMIFAVPIVALVFGYSGFKMMASDSVTEREASKERMLKVLKGFLIMLSAWYIIDFALGELLSPGFSSGLSR